MSDALKYSGSIAEDLKELDYALANGGDVDVFDELFALDWEYTVSIDGQLRSVTMTRTTGGPHCEVKFRLDGAAVVATQWGTQNDAVVTYVPILADYVLEFIYDCMADAGLRASRN